ncbi:MAG: 2Fe-2S iron-sulfur cluster binding domain-containing protein [Rhodospirillaceae bacterium]|nr:2Fe-2S iron-sulfur cluster binding domain-containing protein [Rhodospirillaceae bacterium]
MKITVSLPNGATQDVTGKPGFSVMESLRAAGIPIRAECGGAMACATCHVIVAPEWMAKVGRPDAEESDLLDLSDYRTENSRLCCQIKARPELDGLKIALQLDAYD